MILARCLCNILTFGFLVCVSAYQPIPECIPYFPDAFVDLWWDCCGQLPAYIQFCKSQQLSANFQTWRLQLTSAVLKKKKTDVVSVVF